MTTTGQLADLEPACSRTDAMELFTSLPAVRALEIRGRWRGRELATGHPMDGVLAASGWYGKQFDGPDQVHPLLFAGGDGEVFPVEPRMMPLGLAGRLDAATVARLRGLLPVMKPALRARRHRARLREVEDRGVVTAAMVYDHRAIIDVFRRVDRDTLLGVMDLRGQQAPYFFILERAARVVT